MMERRLRIKLGGLESLLRRARLWRRLTRCWVVMGGIGVVLLIARALTGWNPALLWPAFLAAGIIAAIVLWIQELRRPVDIRGLVRRIESDDPEVRHLLSTATEQEPDPDTGRFGFLQMRVIEQALSHRRGVLWQEELAQQSSAARGRHLMALAGFAIVVMILANHSPALRVPHLLSHSGGKDEITVTPGDTEVERGSGLVISARFGGTVPAEASLVLTSASGKVKRIMLERHLVDPVFGSSLAEVTEDGFYHIEYGAKKTREFKIAVFEYPSLVQADAALDFPDYTGLTNKTIRDTRRVSAVEGTRLTYTLQLNKPVVRARFVSKEQSINLLAQTNAIAALNNWVMTNSGRYSLELVDAQGRTNKFPADFSLQAIPDRRPDLKIAFPRGDQRVSRLEELQLQAEAADDFGLLKYGIGFGVAGDEPQLVELGQTATANEKKQFGHLVPMEKLNVEVDQLVSYFAWADDYGPDGKVRRSYSDMFFAEIRPFEEIYRRDQSGAGDTGGQQGQQGGQGGNESSRLAELQKQIVIATWKLRREKEGTPSVRLP